MPFEPQVLWNSLGLYSKSCLKSQKLLPIFEKVTLGAHLALKLICCLLFLTMKDCGVSNSDETVVYLMEWVLVKGKSFQVQMQLK